MRRSCESPTGGAASVGEEGARARDGVPVRAALNTPSLRRRVIPELFGEALEHGRSPDRLSVLTERPVEDASTRNERFNRLNVK